MGFRRLTGVFIVLFSDSYVDPCIRTAAPIARALRLIIQEVVVRITLASVLVHPHDSHVAADHFAVLKVG